MKKILTKLLNFIEDSILKNHSCISCYREIDDNTKNMICYDCKKLLSKIDGKICEKCGDKLNVAGKCINFCEEHKYRFDKNISLFYYDETASKIIKNLKYGKKRYIASFVAKMMIEKLDEFKDIDIICYVPMTKKRKRERGFNQAEEIAKIIGEEAKISVLDLLLKIRETKHQAGGTQKERLKNLEGTFAANEKFASDIKGKNILIVDDVFTTGSTLSECAKMLKKFKPQKVFTMTFAKTKFEINCQNVIEI